MGRNVWEHGTGAVNVEGCRVPPANDPTRGRWPPNLLLSHGPECEETCAPECPVAMLDAQSGERRAGPSLSGTEASSGFSGPVYGNSMGRRAWQSYGDVGGASRFFPTFPYEPRFLYMPKASTPERESGLVGMSGGARRNPHPTVKPLGLMRWLCRLVTPPGGLVLDPFAGSGSTGVAALREDFRFLGIEEDAEYVEIARSRIEEDAPLFQRMTR